MTMPQAWSFYITGNTSLFTTEKVKNIVYIIL